MKKADIFQIGFYLLSAFIMFYLKLDFLSVLIGGLVGIIGIGIFNYFDE